MSFAADLNPEPAPDCLGCLLLSQPERCVEYRDGVRCDECGEQ